MRRRWLWILLPAVLLLGLSSAVYQCGRLQLEVSWVYLGASPEAPIGSNVRILQLISGPKKGPLRLESVEVDEYRGMELVAVEVYRGEPGDIHLTGDLTYEIAERLADVRKAQLLPNAEGVMDYIVLTFKVLDEGAVGPMSERVTYRWFGIPYTLTFRAR